MPQLLMWFMTFWQEPWHNGNHLAFIALVVGKNAKI